jgi:hypothetical protein
MLSLWRTVFIWLLVLSVPAQGVAANGMQHCAPKHERLLSAAKAAQAMHAHAHMHAGIEAEPTAVNASPVPATAHLVAGEPTKSTSDFQCSACAACCVALGLPNGVLDLPDLVEGPSLAPPTMAGVPSFVPGGLDRPPRIGFA